MAQVHQSPFYYLLHTGITGKLKIASPFVGLLAMAFTAAGIHHNSAYAAEYAVEKKNYHPQPGQTETDERGFFYEFHFWLAQLAATLIILAWIFSVVIFLTSLMPELTGNPTFLKIVAFSHLGFFIALILGALLAFTYIFNVYQRECGELSHYGLLKKANEERKKRGDKERELPNCPKGVFLTIEYGIGVSEGWKAILFVFAALFAIGHAVVCLLIFLWTFKGIRAAPARVTTGSRSQASAVTPSRAPSQGYAPQIQPHEHEQQQRMSRYERTLQDEEAQYQSEENHSSRHHHDHSNAKPSKSKKTHKDKERDKERKEKSHH